jgi:hypothetical protein
MKKVFSKSSDVMHLFANQQQNEACNASRNVFFDEPTKIYSYGKHYLLGEFTENANGESALIINNAGYSVTTRKHISELQAASRHLKRFYTSDTDPETVLAKLEFYAQKLQRANKKELYILPAHSLYKEFNEWLNWSDRRNDIFTILAIEEIYLIFSGSDYSEYLAKKEAIIKAEKAAKLKAAKVKTAIEINKFYTHEINRIWRGDQDYVRLSENGFFIETSQQVSVGVEGAKILYSLILSGKDIKGFQIDKYTVTSINGTLTIGCHKINLKSMHRVMKPLL